MVLFVCKILDCEIKTTKVIVVLMSQAMRLFVVSQAVLERNNKFSRNCLVS